MLRFAIYLDSRQVNVWQRMDIESLLELEFATPALLLFSHEDRRTAPSVPTPLEMFLAPDAAWRYYDATRLNPKMELLQPAGLPASLSRTKVVVLQEVPDDNTAEMIANANLDFVLHYSESELPTVVGEATRLGSWQVRYGGASASESCCFTESLERKATVRVELTRSSGHKRQVLEWAEVRVDKASFPVTKRRALRAGVGLAAKYSRALEAKQDTTTGAEPAETTLRLPHRMAFAKFAIQIIEAKLKVKWLDVAYIQQWGVGFADITVEALLKRTTRPEIRWLEQRPGLDFFADPFVLEREAETLMLVEHYRHADGRGHIASLAIGEDGKLTATPIIESDTHLSYPFIFMHDGNVYCVPENGEARRVSLYRMDDDGQWVFVKDLLEDVEAYDPTIMEHDGLWWMFYAQRLDPGSFRLHAWYAQQPCASWRPHDLNPLTCDIRSSRPAGTPFVHEGRVYRPAQDCARAYGAALSIFEITELTPSSYREEFVTTIQPNPKDSFNDGFHTLSRVDEECFLVDGRRRVFSPARLARRLALRGST